jgi:DUF1009 family protein
MLALIAGKGALPKAVANAAPQRPLICALDPFVPETLPVDRSFKVEKLGSFLHWLKRQGVSQICMCGSVDRPSINPKKMDWRTLLLVPRMYRALKRGDDGALRIVIGMFEDAGFEVVGAHEMAPSLLPPEGVLTKVQPDAQMQANAALADKISFEQGQADLGQSCVIKDQRLIVREDDAGTDAMLNSVTEPGGALFKGPKFAQDHRVDLPVIGPDTARGIIRAGLDGIAIAHGGVMVLEQAEVLRLLDEAGKFLWVRKSGT